MKQVDLQGLGIDLTLNDDEFISSAIVIAHTINEAAEESIRFRTTPGMSTITRLGLLASVDVIEASRQWTDGEDD